ncbi:MAG: hypothetical protein B6245_02615 [Desulfobacteraceae bacterium 4572_88]|nr:MAG: hypothetical protein B6245_02615 [Desulfobacteraceae bacterium 4572_88]RLC21596.1 MAG: sigma-70 family RNA polymerase sigma factor [Deltaproteobacteria bacterium]
MNQRQEKTIIEHILKGYHDQYTLIVEKYKGPVFNLICRMTGNYQDAEDLAQETFVRTYESLWRFNTKKRFFTWLCAIALNLTRNYLKKKTFFAVSEPETLASDTNNPEQILVRQQEADWLAQCLGKLPIRLRAAVVLRYYQDLSFEEVSEILGISLSAAKMRVYRGLEKLRELMAP